MIKKLKSFFYTQRELLFATIEQNKIEINSVNERLSSELNNIKAELDLIKNLLSNQNDMITSLKYKFEDSLNVQKHIEDKFRFFDPELSLLTPTSKRKILICGFYGAYNLGDELMLETLLEALSFEKDLAITVMVAYNEGYDPLERENVRFIHYPQTLYDFEWLAEYFDAVIFGGGALISDSDYKAVYSKEVSLCTTLVDLSEKMEEKGKVCIWAGLSASEKLTDSAFISRLRKVVPGLSYCSIRDAYSLEELRRNGVDVSKAVLSHDIVLANKAFDLDRINKKDGAKICIGIVLICNFPEINEQLCDIVKTVLDYAKSLGREFVINLIPFYNYIELDKIVLKSVAESAGDECIKVTPYVNSMNEIADIISQQDMIISMRYHASLVSLLLGKPLLTLLLDTMPHYPNKMKYISETYDNETDYILFSEYNKDIFVRELERITVKNKFKDNTKARKEAKDEVRLLVDLLKNGTKEI